MNVALQVATHMAIAGGSPYHRHRKAYGYGPAAEGKATTVGAAGVDPEGNGPMIVFIGCMFLMAAAVYIGVTVGA